MRIRGGGGVSGVSGVSGALVMSSVGAPPFGAASAVSTHSGIQGPSIIPVGDPLSSPTPSEQSPLLRSANDGRGREGDDAPNATGRSRTSLYLGATTNLALAVVGSTVLPIGATFAITGVLPGIAMACVVCMANLYTSDLLLAVGKQVGSSMPKPELGAVAFAYGGARWRTLVDVAQTLLLFGGNCGNLALQGELWTRAVMPNSSEPSNPYVLVVATLGFVFPLCCLRSMRALETFASAGNLLLVGLAIAVFVEAARSGFPLQHDRRSWMNTENAAKMWPVAFAQFGFDFYITPQLLPLLYEAKLDAKPISRGAWTALTFALIVYCIVGSCEVLRIGQASTDNLFTDMHVSGVAGQILAVSLAVFVALGYAPVLFALRYSVLSWRSRGHEGDEKASLATHVATTFVLVVSSMGVAFWGNAATIFALTGATGAYLVCYLTPCVAAHRLLPRAGTPEASLSGVAAPPVIISVLICVVGGVMSSVAVVSTFM